MTRSKMKEQLKTLSMEGIMTLAAMKDNRTGFLPITNAEMLKDGIANNAYGGDTKAYADSLICIPMDEEWKNNLKNSWWASNYEGTDMTYRNRYGALIDKLLSFGGEEACLPAFEEDYEKIMKYGQFWFGKGAKRMMGEPSRCHSNVANLWEQNKGETLICTGYALSQDGVWRQHSWLMWLKPRSNQIVETTVPRIAYFGVCFDYERCLEFASDNF